MNYVISFDQEFQHNSRHSVGGGCIHALDYSRRGRLVLVFSLVIPVPDRNLFLSDSMSAQHTVLYTSALLYKNVLFRRPIVFFPLLFLFGNILGRGLITYPWRDISHGAPPQKKIHFTTRFGDLKLHNQNVIKLRHVKVKGRLFITQNRNIMCPRSGQRMLLANSISAAYIIVKHSGCARS
jgi:hypothetical protein